LQKNYRQIRNIREDGNKNTEKAGHPWFKALKLETVQLGTARYMVVPTGKYIAKYNMIIPKDLAEYE